MHPWPKVAWVLLLTLISDWLETTVSRDFTIKDIIYLHPSTTPYPGGFKCFTCEDAADNFQCNRWAPDMYCPRETRYCHTSHTMTAVGDSVSVTKRCVALDECLYTGCTDSNHEGHRVCTACCEGNICNMPVPRNESTAIFATLSPLNRTSSLSQDWSLWLAVVFLVLQSCL